MKTSETIADAKLQSATEKEKWLLISPSICMNVIGFVLCQIALFNFIFYYGYRHVYLANSYLSVPLLIFFATMVLVYLITWRASDFLQNNRVVWVIFPLATTLVSTVIYFFFPDETLVNYLCPFLFGLGIVICTVLFYERCCLFFQGKMALVIILAIAISFLIIFLIAQLSGRLFMETHVISLLAAYALYGVVSNFFTPSSSLPKIESRENDAHIPFTWKPLMLTFAATFSQTFMLVWVLEDSKEVVSISIAAITVFVLVFMIAPSVYFAKTGRICEDAIKKIHLPLVATCAYLFTIFSPRVTLWLAILGYAFTMLPVASSLSALAKQISIASLSSIRALGMSSTIASLGYLFGLISGSFSFFTDQAAIYSKFLIALVVLFMIVIWMIVGLDSAYPTASEAEVVPSITSDGKVQLKEKSLEEKRASEEESSNSKRRYYQEKIERFADNIGLTSRQSDVLALLARGRNTAYISENLFISVHTVKAHTYEIYKKANVHSQQELISLIDDMKVD